MAAIQQSLQNAIEASLEILFNIVGVFYIVSSADEIKLFIKNYVILVLYWADRIIKCSICKLCFTL